MISIVFLLLPFIQLGINWWIGVPLICLLIALKCLDFENWSKIDLTIPIFIVLAVVFSSAIVSSADTRVLLRACRELLVFLIMILALSPILFKERYFNLNKLVKILEFVSLGILILTLLQFILIQSGRTISLPENWYPRKLFTPTSLDFSYSHIRPSATFTEPSYLGLIAYSFLTMGISLHSKSIRSKHLIWTSLGTVLLSQSKSGVAFSLALLILLFWTKMKKKNISSLRISTISAPLALIGIIVYLTSFTKIGDSTSIRDRIFIPIRIVFEFFLNQPFGIPYYQRLELAVDDAQGTNWFALSHNGVLNLIFDYGILGLVILVVLYSALRENGILFLLFVFLGIQNGSFFDFDKAVIALFVSVFLRSCNNSPNSIASRT